MIRIKAGKTLVKLKLKYDLTNTIAKNCGFEAAVLFQTAALSRPLRNQPQLIT